MTMALRILPALQHNCRIIKGIPKKRLPNREPCFEAKLHQPVIVALKQHLSIGENDPRLILTEVRRTSRSIYHSGYHPDFGSFEVKQTL
jgi:hypothetical protein